MTEPSRSRRSFPEEIVFLLRAKILSGQLPIGSRLPPERELSLQLGTNRNTLREALRALESQGLLRARQGAGIDVVDFRSGGEISLLPHFFAVAPNGEQLHLLSDLLGLRTLVAVEVIGMTAERATASAKRQLRALCHELSHALDDGRSGDIANCELRLYRACVEASGSLTSLWLFNSIEKVVRNLLDVFPDLWVIAPGTVDRWNVVLDAVDHSNAQLAREELGKLLRATDDVILSALGLATPAANA